jgi:hypothetical protein
LAFSISASPQLFGIRASDSEQSLTQLQQKMQQGSMVTIYYDSVRRWASPANFGVYQLEQKGAVVYSIVEVRQRALARGSWLLIGWLLLAVIVLWVYLQQRPSILSET